MLEWDEAFPVRARVAVMSFFVCEGVGWHLLFRTASVYMVGCSCCTMWGWHQGQDRLESTLGSKQLQFLGPHNINSSCGMLRPTDPYCLRCDLHVLSCFER